MKTDWNNLKELSDSKYTTLGLLFFLVLLVQSADLLAQAQPGTACADAALLSQWWGWTGGAWAAGIATGLFVANPVIAGLIAGSVISLQVFAYYGGAAGVC